MWHNITWRTRFAYWITKTTDAHSEYVIAITFPQEKVLHECASNYCVICKLTFFLILIILLSKSYRTQLQSVAARTSWIMFFVVCGKWEKILILAVIKNEMTSHECFFLPCFLYMFSPPDKEPSVGLQINIWVCSDLFEITNLIHNSFIL